MAGEKETEEPPVLLMTREQLNNFINTVPESVFQGLILKVEAGYADHGERTQST